MHNNMKKSLSTIAAEKPLRTADGIDYILQQKNIKNVYIRIQSNGQIHVSANLSIPLHEIDRYVISKSEWIKAAASRASKRILYVKESDNECLALFTEISNRIYPLFKNYLPYPPEIRVKYMKSAWGICHRSNNYITLNKVLIQKPTSAIEYVILHEYTHFIYPNHQKGFHSALEKLMPDYKERKKMLNKT